MLALSNLLMLPACTRSNEPTTNITNTTNQDEFTLQFKLLQPKGWSDLGLTNRQIIRAHSSLTERGFWTVNVEFTPIGYSKFRYLTASLVGDQFGVFVNEKPMYGTTETRGFPILQPCQLAVPGVFTEDQAKHLAVKLNSSKLRARNKNITSSTIFLSTKLPQQDLLFGQKQLEMMLLDRPEMKAFVKPGDNVWNWTVNQLAGEGTKRKILWGGDISHQEPSIDSSISIPDNGLGFLYIPRRLRKALVVNNLAQQKNDRIPYRLSVTGCGADNLN